MAGLLYWAFPCLAIGGSAEGIQSVTTDLSAAGAVEESHRMNVTPYQPVTAGSMQYPNKPLTPKVGSANVIVRYPQQGIFIAQKPEPTSEVKAFKQHHASTPVSQAKARVGRPELTVCIPVSRSKPPVLKSGPSPDDSLDNQQALAAAAPVDKPEAKSAETPAYTRWLRAQASQTPTQQAKQANLKAELENFSIASQEENLSGYGESPLAIAAKPAATLRSTTSSHDFAHEKHRDMATRLTSNTLYLAERIAGQNGTGPEDSKDELRLGSGRRLC